MQHNPQNQERATNLPILTVSGLGEVSRVESNIAASSTPGGALPSIPSKFQPCDHTPPTNTENFDFSTSAE